MLKKIFMVIGILAVIGVVVVVGGSVYFASKIATAVEEKEPEFRQYVTMTTEEQNAYVEKNVEEIFDIVFPLSGANDQELAQMKAVMKELDNNPEIRQAKIDWGRSAVAMFIVDNEKITKGLSPEVLKSLQTERAEYDLRQLKYKQLIDNYKLKQ